MSFLLNPYSSFGAGGGGLPGDPGGVSPSDLSGLELWLKANSLTSLSNDAEIATWSDSSGNGRDATGVLRTNKKPRLRTTEGPNSMPAVILVDSIGDGGHFTLPNFMTGFTAGNVFFVVKLTQNPVGLGVQDAASVTGDWGSGGDAYYHFPTDSKIYDDFGTTARKNAIAHTGQALTSWQTIDVRSASGAWSYHMSGTQLLSTGTNTVGWGTAPKIGRVATNTKFMRGWVAEIILYSRVLSSSEKFNTIHTYLNNKYALGLPTS